jgi:hypothetical protein
MRASRGGTRYFPGRFSLRSMATFADVSGVGNNASVSAYGSFCTRVCRARSSQRARETSQNRRQRFPRSSMAAKAL